MMKIIILFLFHVLIVVYTPKENYSIGFKGFIMSEHSSGNKNQPSNGIKVLFLVAGLYMIGKFGYSFYQDHKNSPSKNDSKSYVAMNAIENNKDINDRLIDDYISAYNADEDKHPSEGPLSREGSIIKVRYYMADGQGTENLYSDKAEQKETLKAMTSIFCKPGWSLRALNAGYTFNITVSSKKYPDLWEAALKSPDCRDIKN
ncbi:hypothetical protein SOASR030_32170 [Leminorella grimontii]|uniref:Uncharacterized protein n=1 Tax=Leminorella grimontii TaxID=82981 RepID=A0AAV5N4Q7_9GAMM|nr:hypothetical protein [Leminorella grimontii]KFC92611.1 hypothetical protein GLGR_3720 [Leminorella grimontii ATCC 33999 = DSM 5078]GKX57105.1 hypothetical protein SOASR030_32170 [Leminorella grimontii]VFS62535.1 Uncharacterised protein [Leminorella grimontii]